MHNWQRSTIITLVKHHTLYIILQKSRIQWITISLISAYVILLVSACSSSSSNNYEYQQPSLTPTSVDSEPPVNAVFGTPTIQVSPGSPSSLDTLIATLLPSQAPRISFDRDSYYFGEATSDEEINYAFDYTNVGYSVLKIYELEINTLEGC